MYIRTLLFREQSSGIIHVNNTVRKRRDDRVLDEYEESYFEAEDDDDTIPLNETTTESPTKPLSAKLKDVDLIDNLSLNRSDSQHLQNLNRPASPQNTLRPGSPQNSLSPGSSQNVLRPGSPQKTVQGGLQISTKQVEVSDSPNKSPPEAQNHLTRLPLAKQLPGINHKPVMNIRINSNSTSIFHSNNDIANDTTLTGKLDSTSTGLSVKINEQKEPITENQIIKNKELTNVPPIRTKSVS